MNRPSGVIHDVGYERYAGSRRSATTRWRVIARHQIATAWETWWRYRAALLLAVIVTSAFAGLMYFLTDSMMFRGFRSVRDVPLTIADGVVPASIQWYRRAAFVLSLTVGAVTIAGDRQSGAFSLYVARSIRPIDYIVGKVGAMLALTATLALVGPLVLAILRLGLFDDTDALVDHLVIVPKVLAIGGLSTLTYTMLPLACSAAFASRRQALAVWAGYWLIAGSIAALLGSMTSGWISAFDLASALDSITFRLFDLHLTRRLQIPFGVAVGSIVVHVLAALAIISFAVRRAHTAGIRESA